MKSRKKELSRAITDKVREFERSDMLSFKLAFFLGSVITVDDEEMTVGDAIKELYRK